MNLADAFIQSDLQLHSGYTFSLVHVFPGNRTHNLLRNRRNALPLSHTGTRGRRSEILNVQMHGITDSIKYQQIKNVNLPLPLLEIFPSTRTTIQNKNLNKHKSLFFFLKYIHECVCIYIYIINIHSTHTHFMYTRKYDHISPVLSTLHWLPIKHHIHLKILLTTHTALNGLAP